MLYDNDKPAPGVHQNTCSIDNIGKHDDLTLSGEQNKQAIEIPVDFLLRYSPKNFWVLAALHPENAHSPSVKTFDPSQRKAAMKWIKDHNGTHNLYFHVNPTKKLMNKKAKREDIKELSYLHVDIDPRVGEDLKTEQNRCLALLTDNLPAGVPEPTFITFSGGGYQAFWKLKEPIIINGDLDIAEDVKRYNQQLESLFGADNCHNVDRLMRLPGTWNIPNKLKAQKGRTTVMSATVSYNKANIFDINQFAKANFLERNKSNKLSNNTEEFITAKVVNHLSDLNQFNVPDRVKIIIAQGMHPDEPKAKDNSRSAWLFDVSCSLVRCDVPDNIIVGILLDRNWSISESVLEKQNPKKYALRQIERAKDYTIDPLFEELNNRHFAVENCGGKFLIAEFKKNYRNFESISFQSTNDFKNRYANKEIKIGSNVNGSDKTKPLEEYWLKHPRRRTYKSIVFEPNGSEVMDGSFNLWQGFPLIAKEGDWSLMHRHIDEVLAAGDKAAGNYILKWAAWAVQNPDKTAEVALVFKGGQGTGKSTFGRAMATLFGIHSLQISSPTHLVGRFNAHMQSVCLLFADEALRPQDKAASGALKTLLTEPTISIEGKGRNVVTSKNCVKIIMASNNDFVASVEQDDRRFAVFKVADSYKRNKEYFTSLNKQLDNGGYEAMFYYLENMLLEDWHPRDNIPETAERTRQKEASFTGFEAIFLDLLKAGEFPEEIVLDDPGNGTLTVGSSRLKDYINKKIKYNISSNKIADLLKKLGFKADRKIQGRGFMIPILTDARKAWDSGICPITWDTSIELDCWTIAKNDPCSDWSKENHF